jgi:hypothetical protein
MRRFVAAAPNVRPPGEAGKTADRRGTAGPGVRPAPLARRITMRSTPRLTTVPRIIVMAMIALAVDLAPSPLVAQPTTESPAQRRVGRDQARADSLVAQAETLQRSRGQWLEAARLYRRAALLRGDDSAAVTAFRLAAWAYGAAGDVGLALAMMEQGAERATRIGDVERAIGCFIDAALIAKAAGRNGRVSRLMERTYTLLASPLLPAERRLVLERRIVAEPTIAGTIREP